MTDTRTIGTTEALLQLGVDVDTLCSPSTRFLPDPATCARCEGEGGVGQIRPQPACPVCAGRGVLSFVQTAPLLDQLQAAVGSGGEQGTGHQPPGPRLPVAAHALAVSAEIRLELVWTLRMVGDRRGHDRLAKMCRMWASHAGAWSATDPGELMRAQANAASWVRMIRGVLGQSPDAVRYRWRGQCPQCERSSIAECESCGTRPRDCTGDGKHELIRRPVLMLDTDTWTMRCTNPACSYVRTGYELAGIASQVWSTAS